MLVALPFLYARLRKITKNISPCFDTLAILDHGLRKFEGTLNAVGGTLELSIMPNCNFYFIM